MKFSAFIHSSVYVELADQYKVMDAVSDVPRRNMLARHLREVVDILEQKVYATSLPYATCAEQYVGQSNCITIRGVELQRQTSFRIWFPTLAMTICEPLQLRR
jgi:hypothetical protein